MSLVSKVKTITGNSDYRVKDVIDKIGKRWEHSGEQVRRSKKYEGTILQTYLKLFQTYEKPLTSSNETKNSRSLLLRLIKERIADTRMECPTPNELVVHLRMGDTVAKGNGSVRPGNKDAIIENISKYIVGHPTISKITLTTCFAFQDWSESSKREYISNNPKGVIPDWGWTQKKHDLNIVRFNQIESSIRKLFPGLELDVMSSTNIDDDMCYTALANHFIPSSGGFSQLLLELSKMNKSKSNSKLDFLPHGKLMPSTSIHLFKNLECSSVKHPDRGLKASQKVLPTARNINSGKKKLSNRKIPSRVTSLGPLIRSLR